MNIGDENSVSDLLIVHTKKEQNIEIYGAS